MTKTWGGIALTVAWVGLAATSARAAGPDLWSQRPLARPETPPVASSASNPIDAFLASKQREKGLEPLGPVDKQTLLRRVTFDLTGVPPTPAEQQAFLNDDSPYDQFVHARLTSYRTVERPQMTATGRRFRKEPRPDDLFALGPLSRGAVLRDGKAGGELPISAVETVSAAFMGMTVACAKCHDHMYDPIKQRDYYAMKALFDPLVVRKVILATPAEVLAEGKAIGENERKREGIMQHYQATTGGSSRHWLIVPCDAARVCPGKP